MANLSSPPQAKQRPINAFLEHEYRLKDSYENRAAFSLGVAVENQRLGKNCSYSKTGTKNGDYSSKASNIVHLCKHCDQFQIIAHISQSQLPSMRGRITIEREPSVLHHAPNCPTAPPPSK
jgi:hypothetical protein